MTGWTFDQPRNVACITCRPVLDGQPVLVVTHYKDDHSWAFLNGSEPDNATALLVAMSTVVDRHPDLHDISDLPPGWSAKRDAAGQPWSMRQDE
ncbi:hypothetical protein [Tianweitania sp.]|uniref:hypothetical protein n=1 Tax=Tianweitania sp. TaxID=2021634 RepID=UPI00289F450C|nr:hypothetical protein [Tianweitania sp.]